LVKPPLKLQKKGVRRHFGFINNWLVPMIIGLV